MFPNEKTPNEPSSLGQSKVMSGGRKTISNEKKKKIARNGDINSPAFLKNHKLFGLMIPKG